MTFLKYGAHEYSVEAEGYTPVQGTAIIDRDGTKTIQVKMESIMATLNVKTETEGASIKINGQKKGADYFSDQYAPGVYLIEVSKTGYRTYSQTVELQKRDVQTIIIPALTPVYGVLNVAYKPIGAEIYIDGKYVGTSPNVFSEVQVGNHKVTIKKQGYTTYNVIAKMIEGKTVNLEGALSEVKGPTHAKE